MTAVFKIRRSSAYELDALVSLMTANGYKVIFEKGDRVSMKVVIKKNGEEYVGVESDE